MELKKPMEYLTTKVQEISETIKKIKHISSKYQNKETF